MLIKSQQYIQRIRYLFRTISYVKESPEKRHCEKFFKYFHTMSVNSNFRTKYLTRNFVERNISKRKQYKNNIDK